MAVNIKKPVFNTCTSSYDNADPRHYGSVRFGRLTVADIKSGWTDGSFTLYSAKDGTPILVEVVGTDTLFVWTWEESNA